MDAITAPGREKPPIRFDPLSPEYLADLYPFLTAVRRSGLSRSDLECFGPSVWTGRALQAENKGLEKVGLAHLYPAY